MSLADQLTKLSELLKSGALTEEEFNTQKGLLIRSHSIDPPKKSHSIALETLLVLAISAFLPNIIRTIFVINFSSDSGFHHYIFVPGISESIFIMMLEYSTYFGIGGSPENYAFWWGQGVTHFIVSSAFIYVSIKLGKGIDGKYRVGAYIINSVVCCFAIAAVLSLIDITIFGWSSPIGGSLIDEWSSLSGIMGLLIGAAQLAAVRFFVGLLINRKDR